jgi:glucosamine--fructose-6-phosphate aminotransferase (isomerizing)
MSLHEEILEQPHLLANLLDTQRSVIKQVADAIHAYAPKYVFLAARGTSDNAGRYANYLWGAFNQMPLALATPSLFTYYEQPPKLHGALVVAISQSGMSPDIISVLEEGKRQGCLTLAITNNANSPLAKAAELVLDIQAGAEKAVAATKTYTTELMIIAMLSIALGNDKDAWKQIEQVPGWAADVLKQDEIIQQMSERFRYMKECVVLGRGFNYATAFEWALKLKELTYVVAEPYSSADFQHGPIAMVEGGFPIMAVAPQGKVFDSMLSMIAKLRNEHAAELVVISNSRQALSLAQSPIVLPDMPEWVSPIVSILPAQLFACSLTQVKGYDPEKPRTIQKVTETH